MKALVIGFFSLMLFSCSKDGILSIPASLSTTADFAVPALSPDVIERSFTIDASSSTELQNKLSLIKEYEVTSIRYQVLTFSGPAGTKASGTFTIGNIAFGITNLALDQPAEYTLQASAAQLKEIADDLLSGNNIIVKISGSITNKPVEFKMKFTMDIKARI